MTTVALWFTVAIAAGSFGAFIIGGHGSIIYLLYAVVLAVSGSLGSALSLILPKLSTANPWLRLLAVAIVAIFPILTLGLYGVVADESYPLIDAATFIATFAVPTTVVAGVAERAAHGHFPWSNNAV